MLKCCQGTGEMVRTFKVLKCCQGTGEMLSGYWGDVVRVLGRCCQGTGEMVRTFKTFQNSFVLTYSCTRFWKHEFVIANDIALIMPGNSASRQIKYCFTPDYRCV